MKTVFNYFSVTDDDAGRRLERIARKFLEHLPLSLIHKSIRNGFIRVNGDRKTASYRIQSGDRLDICESLLAERQNRQNTAALLPFGIDGGDKQVLFTDVFVNEHIRIVNKAYGIPVHGTNVQTTSVDAAIRSQYLTMRGKNGGIRPLSFVPGPLHRLDRRTTGLVAFSQSLAGAQWFSESLAKKRITKTYIALLQGRLTEKCLWEHRIEKSEKNVSAAFNTVKVSPLAGSERKDDIAGKRACTTVQPLAWGGIGKKEFTLARFTIQTGRTHQIRAQSAFCGFPLLGDTAYGADFFAYPDDKGQKLFLHAHCLFFEKNRLEIPQKISACPPPFFNRFIGRYLPDFKFSPYISSNEDY